VEDFSKVYTVECDFGKGFEVVKTTSDTADAIAWFRSYLNENVAGDRAYPVRITSPTDEAILTKDAGHA
jgi:hypothetical protein